MIVTICLHHLFFFSLSFNFFSSFPALPSLPNLFCPILLHPFSRRCFVPHRLSSSPVISPFPPLLLLLLPLLLFDLNSAYKKLFFSITTTTRIGKRKRRWKQSATSFPLPLGQTANISFYVADYAAAAVAASAIVVRK